MSKIDVIKAIDGTNIVVIQDMRFRGKRKIKWKQVEQYLKEYIGKHFEITESAQQIYIGKDFPDEFTSSKDTMRLRGTLAKAKANAVQGLPQLLANAENERFEENLKEKHSKDAKFGWYRYTTTFALPSYNEDGETLYFNVFRIEMLIRHADDGRKYLYDMVNIKKKRATRLGISHTVTNPLLIIYYTVIVVFMSIMIG